jgi:hypothetical protein
MGVWDWLKTNHEAASTTASIVGNIITLGALIVTVIVSSCQLNLTRRSLQNSLVYQLQKDERAIGLDFLSGRSADTGPIFAEIHSVFLQRELGTIPDVVWNLFQRDFCKLMSKERLRRDWDNLGKDAFSQDFVLYMNRIKMPDSTECGAAKP